jgi:uncharacterized protein YejL (UPF0352 family)
MDLKQVLQDMLHVLKKSQNDIDLHIIDLDDKIKKLKIRSKIIPPSKYGSVQNEILTKQFEMHFFSGKRSAILTNIEYVLGLMMQVEENNSTSGMPNQ